MKIVINNNRKIIALQEELSAEFPGLTLAFHVKPPRQGDPAPEKLVSHNSKTLRECRALHNEGTVEILPTMHIAGVKDIFRDIFGLSVEILQKAENGNTIMPENEKLTIEELNSGLLVHI